MAEGVEAGRGAGRQLVLGTVSFAVCFAAWGLVAAFAPRFRQIFSLSATETALLVSTPVLLGSLARLPMGMITDRAGGRLAFGVLMIASAIPAFFATLASGFRELLVAAFFLGIAGSSFAVGVGFVSRWFPPERQGGALGIYGLGNIGQSAVVFLGPLLAAAFGWQNVFRGVAALLVVWAILFLPAARNAPIQVKPKPISELFRLLAREKLAWVLAAFYALTFGGFVAFSIYLPSLLKDGFRLEAADAGLRTAGFVVLATLMRPIGGWLSDRIGGARLLGVVFFGIAPFALLMAWPSMLPFTVGALGCAALLGTGNGAVFKLVPQYFPRDTGTVTGLVGAMGGLGGFFPPLLLGAFRDSLGTVWPGFVLLALASLLLERVNARVFLAREPVAQGPAVRVSERLRAGAWASLWTALLVAAIVVGSRNLENFDPALVIYTFAVVFATFGVVYHYNVWLDKPPTRIYWDRGWQIFLRLGYLRGSLRLFSLVRHNLAEQRFIRRRSHLRWWMHQCLFWGCLLAVAITFPLVFGWISFGSTLDDPMQYVTYLFGFPAGSFRVRTLVSDLLFHGLDIAAILVLIGVFLSLWRRMRDKSAQTLQSFAMDFLPIFLLFAISVTGLALTASQAWLRGSLYGFLAVLHAITVIAALLYLPFGKFFHIFQRPAQLGVKLYQEAGRSGEAASCLACGQPFASRMHIDDLKQALERMNFDYTLAEDGAAWQNICPSCKRRSLARAQLRVKAGGIR